MTTPNLTEEEELAILFPEPTEFKVGRVAIVFSPMDAGQCMRFAIKARPIIRAAMTALPDGSGAGLLAFGDLLAAILVAAVDFPEDLFAAMAIATGRPVDFLEKLPPKRALDLARKVFEVNADFFDHGADPVASGAPTMQAKSVAPGVGPTH